MNTLLPPNATPLERAAAASLFSPELFGLAGLPAGVQHTLPAGFAPVLAAEYFLAQFAQHFDSAEALLAAGLPWLRERGTAGAVVRALGWIDIAAAVEEDGALLHLDPGSPGAPAQLDDIRALLAASIPAHVRFYRLFHGLDIRHARADRSRWDLSLLDDDSGYVVDGLKLSFGQRVAAVLPTPPRGIEPWRAQLHAATLRRDSMYWDSWVLDGVWEVDLFGGVVAQVSTLVAARVLDAPELIIGELVIDGIERTLDDLTAAAVHARSELVPERTLTRGWSGPWSGTWQPVISILIYEEE